MVAVTTVTAPLEAVDVYVVTCVFCERAVEDVVLVGAGVVSASTGGPAVSVLGYHRKGNPKGGNHDMEGGVANKACWKSRNHWDGLRHQHTGTR